MVTDVGMFPRWGMLNGLSFFRREGGHNAQREVVLGGSAGTDGDQTRNTVGCSRE